MKINRSAVLRFWEMVGGDACGRHWGRSCLRIISWSLFHIQIFIAFLDYLCQLHILVERYLLTIKHVCSIFLIWNLNISLLSETTMFLMLEYIRIARLPANLIVILNNVEWSEKLSETTLHACTVLSVVGNLMREYPDLLFDFRIVKKWNIPEGYSAV